MAELLAGAGVIGDGLAGVRAGELRGARGEADRGHGALGLRQVHADRVGRGSSHARPGPGVSRRRRSRGRLPGPSAAALEDRARRKTARDNVGFALLAGDLPRTLRRERAAAALVEVDLPPEARDKYLRQYLRQLSGGMRQQVALVRALSVRPDLLLRNESFSALDTHPRRAFWRC